MRLGRGDVCLIRSIAFLYLGCAATPLLAQNPDVQIPAPLTAPQGAVAPQTPIIKDTEFKEAIPSLDDAPLESIEAWDAAQESREEGGSAQQQAGQTAADPEIKAVQDGDVVELLPDPPVTDPLLDDPLPPIDGFDAEPPLEPTQAAEREARATRYVVRVDGLDAIKTVDVTKDADAVAVEAAAWRDVRARFSSLSALKDGGGRADSRAEVAQRARADRQLLLDILNGQGFFDAEVRLKSEVSATDAGALNVVMTVVSGRLYHLGQIAFTAPAVQPTDLISGSFAPRMGDAIVADVIMAAEANISVKLPQSGYPFATIGQRDILLDSETGVGDYTLPVDTGARSYFGQLRTEGTPVLKA